MMRSILSLLALMSALTGPAAATGTDEKVWSALKGGGHVVLMRHAITEPGIGDPPSFVIGDCSTQRNLSEQGRRDAKKIGEEFRRRRIPVSEVLSSRWCRCIDTANLAFDKSQQMSMLDSLFNDRERTAEDKTREVKAYIAAYHARSPSAGNLVLVTHNQNIQALTGVSPMSGEMVVVAPEKDGAFKVVGSLKPPDR